MVPGRLGTESTCEGEEVVVPSTQHQEEINFLNQEAHLVLHLLKAADLGKGVPLTLFFFK